MTLRKFAPSVWCLFDAPSSMEIWEQMLEILVARKAGIMVRPGEGLDPFLLLPKAIEAGLKAAIYLHLRDTNRIALDSILRSAQALKLHRIFLGDPRPVPGVTPREPINAPAFLAHAQALTDDALLFGCCNRLALPADVELLQRFIDCGVHTVAVPVKPKQELPGGIPETWNWAIAPDIKLVSGRTTLIDFTIFDKLSPELLESTLAAAFEEERPKTPGKKKGS